uniref:Uncharacterized protein n=1 Tax=Panagrellus redivivus TaxID=6233 RepID=A0A7E4VAQ3_PANRE
MTASGSNLSSLRHRVIVEIKPSSAADLEEGFFTPGPLNCLPAERKNDCVLLDHRDYISTGSGLVAATSGFFTPVVPSALTHAAKNSSVVVPTRIPKTASTKSTTVGRVHGRPSPTNPLAASSLATTTLSTKTATGGSASGSQTAEEEHPPIRDEVKVPVTRKRIQTTTAPTTVKPTTRRRTTKPTTTSTTTTTIPSTKPARLARPGPHQLDGLWVDVGIPTPYSTSTNAIPFVFTTTTPFITSTLTTRLPSRRTTAPALNQQSEEVDSGDESGLPDGDAIDQPDTMRVKVKNDYRMTETPLFAVRPTTPMGLPMTSSKPYAATGPVADFPRTQLILIASMSLIILIALVVFWVFCWCQQQTSETKAPNGVAAGYVPIPTDSATPPEMRTCMAASRGPIQNSATTSMNGGMNGIRPTANENGIMRNGIQHNNAMNGNGGIPNGAPPTMNGIANGFNGPKPRVNGLGVPLLNGSAPERKKDFKEWYV